MADPIKVPLLEDENVSNDRPAPEPPQFKHPYVTLATIVLRCCPLIVYLLCGWFRSSFIEIFVIVVILLSLDFWTVKNISGRFMVGLRWWNYIDQKGDSHWVFESRKPELNIKNDPSEVTIFWTTLIVIPLLWAFFFFVALVSFKFNWVLLQTIAVSMNFANLYGYLKCRFGRTSLTESFKSATSSFMKDTIVKSVTSVLVNQEKQQQPSGTYRV